MALLEVKNLSYRFPDGTWALKDISFSLNTSEFLVISGKNGSGKTMLLRCLKGLCRPQEGTISIAGTVASRRVRREIGLVFQDTDSQLVAQTVERDIAFGLEQMGLPDDEINSRVHAALNQMDLFSHRRQRPRTLSGGEKRRLTIAGVLAMDPSIIALDEPFANLDYPSVIHVLEHIVSLRGQGHTVIVVTHEVEKVLAHADRLMLMDQGKLIADGKPDEVIIHAPACGVRIPPGVTAGEMTWLKP